SEYVQSEEFGVDWYLWNIDLNRRCYDFNLYLPPDWEESSDTYPVLITLHGGGGGMSTPGPHPLNELGGGPLGPLFDDEGNFFPESRADLLPDIMNSFVVYPEEQIHNWYETRGYWNARGVNIILDFLLSLYPIDINRIYITGGSYGGWGTWNVVYGNDRPDLKPAAIVPICGALDSISLNDNGLDPGNMDNFDNLPIWQIQSLDDPVVSYPTVVYALRKIMNGFPDIMEGYPYEDDGDYTIDYSPESGLGTWTEGIASNGRMITFTMLRAAGHGGTGTVVDATPAIWEWMYDQSR
ncbi:MAG: hypothetical protein JW874_07740, partial [Spirochaetales bacterium]|nr:hypothetical protein [Spirochaetales bacterium]